MARRSWVYIDGVAYEKGVDVLPEKEVGQAPSVLGDISPFRSPIDGRLIASRSALRDHCARHNVVLVADLKGLPPRTTHTQAPPSEAYREATRRTIADVINSRNY